MNKFYSLMMTLRNQIILAVAMNFPFWVASHYVYVNRPILSYDYIFAVVISSFSFRVAVGYVALSLIFDVVSISAFTYQFSNISDFVMSASDIHHLDVVAWLSFSNVIYSATLFLLFLSYCWMVRIYSNKKKSFCLSDLTFPLLVLFVDIQFGSSIFRSNDSIVVSRNLAGSQLFSIVVSEVKGNSASYSNKPLQPGESVQNLIDISEWAKSHDTKSILFVIVESFGYSKIEQVNQWIFEPLIRPDYSLHVATLPFKGATTSGELRSLCGLSASYLTVQAANTESCLPHRLSMLEWSTASYHGFSRAMFDRGRWWPKIGFRQTTFVEDFSLTSDNTCGSIFRGLCDRALLEAAGNRLRIPKSFVYVLTLDTHLPVNVHPLSESTQKLCSKHSIDLVPCVHIQNLQTTLLHIIHSIDKLDNKPLIVIVGDHAPPFTTLEYRNIFEAGIVPAFIMQPAH